MAARRRLLTALLGLGLLLGGCQRADRGSPDGRPDLGVARPAPSPDRTLEVDMVDVAFQPARLRLKAGQTVQFTFRNWGNDVHEAFIGDETAQRRHARARAGGRPPPLDSGAVELLPGAVGQLTHTFARPGILLIGCHERGHYAAGMRVTITVRP